MSEYKGKREGCTGTRLTSLGTMRNPYQRGTKLHRVFAFMQDGCRHYLKDITDSVTDSVWGLQSEGRSMLPGGRVHNRSRVASALRTIRSHPDLDVRYDGERYHMERIPDVAGPNYKGYH